MNRQGLSIILSIELMKLVTQYTFTSKTMVEGMCSFEDNNK
jgi:hypothetical protein